MLRLNHLFLFTCALTFNAPIFAGTINAPYYFDQKCLARIQQIIPPQFEFACDQSGKCFAQDYVINYLLNCATPFGNSPIHSTKMKAYYLTNQGFK